MTAPIKKSGYAANDQRPSRPKEAAPLRIVMGRQSAGLAIVAGIALFVAGIGTGIAVFSSSQLAPVAPLPPAHKEPAQEKPPARNAVPVEVASPDAQSTEENGSIALPADELTLPIVSPRAAKTADSIRIVADKIGDLPALGHDGASEVRMDSSSAAPINSRLIAAARLAADGNDKDALAIYDAVLAADADNHDALSGKAFVLARNGSYRAAVPLYHRILQCYPKDEMAQRNLVAVLGATPEPSALRELQDLTDADPGNAQAEAALAQQYARAQDLRQAILHFDKAVRGAPANAAYRLGLAIVYDRAGYVDEALTLYRQLLDQEPYAQTAQRLPLTIDVLRGRIAFLQASAGDD